MSALSSSTVANDCKPPRRASFIGQLGAKLQFATHEREATGVRVFHMFEALGQFDRDLIRERTKAGPAAVAARGRKGGRKPVVNAEKLQRAREYIANKLNLRELAARLKIGKTSLYAALQAASAAAT
jgi:DNA invertase Pin-like site-specific DNA recombinase